MRALEFQGVSCDPFLRRTHAPRTSKNRCARTRVRTFILWWSHFAPAPARFTIFHFFGGFFGGIFMLFFGNASQIRIFHGKIASTVYKLIKKSLNNGINIAIFGHFSSKKCAKSDRTSHAQKRAARTHIPHTFQNGFRTHTRATAHRTCACAHAPSQLIA